MKNDDAVVCTRSSLTHRSTAPYSKQRTYVPGTSFTNTQQPYTGISFLLFLVHTWYLARLIAIISCWSTLTIIIAKFTSYFICFPSSGRRKCLYSTSAAISAVVILLLLYVCTWYLRVCTWYRYAIYVGWSSCSMLSLSLLWVWRHQGKVAYMAFPLSEVGGSSQEPGWA